MSGNSTRDTFRDKWQNNPDAVFETTLREGSTIQSWILRRNGLSSLDDLAALLRGRRRILDAGCGNGRVTALLTRQAPPDAEIIGIDTRPQMLQPTASATIRA